MRVAVYFDMSVVLGAGSGKRDFLRAIPNKMVLVRGSWTVIRGMLTIHYTSMNIKRRLVRIPRRDHNRKSHSVF